MPSPITPNEYELEFFVDPMPDGRVLLTCSLCVMMDRTPAAWACLNQFWVGEQMKTHRQEHFGLALDNPI